MAVVAEELISDLIVRDGKLRSGIRSAQQAYGAGIGSMRNDTKRFESEFNKSADGIASGFKDLAATLAAGVSIAGTVSLIDSYTRLQNALKIAGLEGRNLEAVQSDLLALSTRYGVNVEGLANLYGKATDAGRSFGASQAEVLKLTEATSQALLISGTGAEEASGAILGLSQALASGTVRAEEYNQINEGGLRPLLQAAAAAERFGGDINKLRAAMIDGKLSSQEFFNSIMAGSAQLEAQASKATLTLSGAFEALNSALTVYVGEAAASNGVSAALAAGILTLAENLDTLVTVFATIAAVIGTRYAVALGTTVAATVALSIANGRAAQTQAFLNAVMASGAATQNIYGSSVVRTTTLLGSMGIAARGAGAALLAALGGPVGVAILALGAGLAYLAMSAAEPEARLAGLNAEVAAAEAEADRLEAALRKAGVGVDAIEAASGAAKGTVGALSDSFLRASREAHRVGDEAVAAALKIAQANLVKSQIRQAELREEVGSASSARGASVSRFGYLPGQDKDLQNPETELGGEMRKEAAFRRQSLALVEAGRNGVDVSADSVVRPLGGTTPSAGGSTRRTGGRGRSGPSQDEIDERFAREILQYSQQILSARESLATTAEEEADIARRSLEASRRAALNELENNADYNEAQRDRLRQHIEQLAAEEEAIISRRETLRLSEEAADLAATEQGLQQEILQNTYRLAETQGERRRIALEMLDSDYRLRRAELDRIIATEGIAKALKDKAIAERAQLDQITQGRRDQINRDTENPLERLSRESNLTAEQMTEAFQSIQADGLTALSDGITDVIMQTRSLGDVFKSVANQIIADLIRIAVQKFIVNTLVNAASSAFGGGGLTGTSGGMDLRGFRAGGGPVRAGQLYRVNEGQQEFFRPATDGRVVPLSQAQAARPAASAMQGPTIVQLALAPGEMFVPMVEGISGNVAVRTVQSAAPGLVRAATNETLSRVRRPRT